MYCVIQEIKTKRFNEHGYHKELLPMETTMTIRGETSTRYSYRYSEERFHRPIRRAFKISIHQSKRVNGVVTKKQYAVTTVNYYDLADGWLGDCLRECRLKEIAKALEVSIDDIWSILNQKADPLEECIKAEFQQTEEYKVHQEHQGIIAEHSAKRKEFAKQYECDLSEYEYCYDLYGVLRDPDYLHKVKQEYITRKEYEQKSRSYQKSYYSNYSGNNGKRGYSDLKPSTYTENQDVFKKFYRTLSKAFHPDSNPDKDTSEEMKLLNQLKSEWGV